MPGNKQNEKLNENEGNVHKIEINSSQRADKYIDICIRSNNSSKPNQSSYHMDVLEVCNCSSK